MNTTTVLRCALMGGALLLAGCSGSDLTRSFGLTRDAPDEFTVTTRAPLSMPPDFSLRPPQPGASRPQEMSTTQSAEVTVAGTAALAPAPGGPSDSPGQDALIAAAGPPPPPGIRQQVDADAAAAASDRSLTDYLLFWRTPTPPGTLVDPAKEAERLRDNAALGKPADAGDVPIIQRKQKGIFEDLF